MSLNVFFVLFRLLCPENQHQVRVRYRNVGCCCSVQDNVHVVQCDRGNKLKLAATEQSWSCRPPATQLLMWPVPSVSKLVVVITRGVSIASSMYLAEPTVWSLSLSCQYNLRSAQAGGNNDKKVFCLWRLTQQYNTFISTGEVRWGGREQVWDVRCDDVEWLQWWM